MCDVTSSEFGFRTWKFQYFCDLLLWGSHLQIQ
jgi:hypothetical protein